MSPFGKAATFSAFVIVAACAQNHDLGFQDTPMLPGLPFHVHDDRRPHPHVVTPAAQPGGAPSDAIVLFDGKNMSAWISHHSNITKGGSTGAPEWKLENGYMEAVPHTGDIATKEKFGDCQLHVEWAAPPEIVGNSQARGNSGVFLASIGSGDAGYELQVLDCYNNKTYVNGQTGSIYKQSIPLANACKKPGEWQTYDVIWTAPRFNDDGSVKSPARVTAFHNGVLVQNNYELKGVTMYIGQPFYKKHGASPIKLQAHGDPSEPISYRNIWVRPL